MKKTATKTKTYPLIRQRMREMNFTSAQMAALLGITPWTMSRKMMKLFRFTFEEVVCMADALHVEWEEVKDFWEVDSDDEL